MQRIKSTNGFKQCGAALVVSLIILLVMTLIGITSMQSTVMQEKMAGNARDLSTAFQAAEAAARSGEGWLLGLTAVPDPNNCPSSPCDLWNSYGALNPFWTQFGASGYTDSIMWASARTANAVSKMNNQQSPEFFVEFIDIFRDSQNLGQQQDMDGSSFRNVYAVTTRGFGGTNTANAFVQTNFARRF